MLRYFILLSVIVIASSYGIEVHKLMTPEEVQSVFKTDHDNVPDYDVAQTAHGIHENSPQDSIHRILHLKSSTRDIKLYLEPIQGILAGKHTPVWKAQGDRLSPAGIKYTRIANAMDDCSHFYQDPYNIAAFYSTQDEHGEILFEGTIGDDLVVRALPKRLLKVLSRNKRSLSQDYFTFSNRTVSHFNLRQTYDHIVYKNKEVNRDGIREKLGSHILAREFPRHKRSQQDTYVEPPKTVYPQVLVIVDYTHFQSLQTLSEVKRYVISFWNAVDLRYRVFVDPEVRLNIAGIIITTDPNGAPYIQNHRTRPFDGPIVDADKALDHMGHYFYLEQNDTKFQRFVIDKHFDMAMTMTQLNLCNQDPYDHDFDCTTLGYAFRQGACTLSPTERMVRAVGLVEDNGGYIGIVPAAHEIGHLMGARHDGYEEEDEVKCPAYKGHIMSGVLTFTKNIFKWSSCSMEDFHHFFHHPRSECLYNEPPHSRKVARVLPGKIYSLDEQCDRVEGTHACNKDESVCIHLDCLVPDSGGQCRPRAPAAEGSNCGLEHYCINGKCVHRSTKEVVLEQPSELDSLDSMEYPSIEIEKS